MTTPRKKRKANIQKILDNPIKSDQAPLRFQEENWIDWSSYIGFGLSFIVSIFMILSCFFGLLTFFFPLASQLPSIYKDIFDSIFNDGPISRFLVSYSFVIPLTLAITGICIYKSKYPISEKIKKFLLFTFLLSIILSVLSVLSLITTCVDIDDIIISFFAYLYIQFCYLYILGLFWYIYYFYKKSQDGYQEVWLKVILFTLLPLIYILATCVYLGFIML